MTAPLFLLDDLAGDLLSLTGPEGRHAATVRRLQVGEPLDLADGKGQLVRGQVAALLPDGLQVQVLRREQVPEGSPRLVLVQALAKGDRGELAVELATEVGVEEILPWSAARCVVRWDGARGEKALQRWRSTAREAGKQSRQARHPTVGDPVTTAGLVQRSAGATLLVLHEQATVALASVALPAVGEVLLVVGPEGGLTEDELAALQAAGGQAVRLGRSVLRTSSAGAVAAAVISARTTRWA